MLKRTLAVVAGGVAVAGLWGVGPAAAADGAFPAVDRPAAYMVFPKIVVDQAAKLDTMIQISNADGALGSGCQSCPPIWVHCFYVKEISSACRGENFWFRMTPGQPVGWLASEGTDVWSAGDPVPPVQLVDGKFLGELKCYVSNEDGTPDYQNALVGAATTFQYDAVGQILDTRSYNGIGFRALNASAATDLTLVLSDGPGGEYDHCSLQLGLNHRFDVKPRADLSDNSSLTTSITLVPCSDSDW